MAIRSLPQVLSQTKSQNKWLIYSPSFYINNSNQSQVDKNHILTFSSMKGLVSKVNVAFLETWKEKYQLKQNTEV